MKELILDAIYKNDIPAFRRLYGEALDKRHDEDIELCEAAIATGSQVIMSDLLADAIIAGDVERIESLLEAGADPNATDAEGKTSLHAGVYKTKKSLAIIMALINGGGDPNIRDNAGDTPAMIAAAIGNFEIMKAISNAGADVDARDSEGLTPIDTLRILHPETYEIFTEYIRNHGQSFFSREYPDRSM